MAPPLLKHLEISSEQVHFNNAGLSPMLPAAVEAVHSYMRYHSANGSFAWPEILQRAKHARQVHAQLLSCGEEQVAFFQTCAAAISQVALGIEWDSGDEIIIWDQEYPSNAFPWFEAARRSGCRVSVLESEPDFSTPTEKLIDAISERTKVVAVSWVQYQTGAMSDLKALSEACRQHDCWLVVDAIQGIGVIPFSMVEFGVDAVCGGSHKWLMGPIGHGFLALRKERLEELNPLLHGAMTYGSSEDRPERDKLPKSEIGRFEPGVPHIYGAAGAAASIEVLLSEGINNINSHAVGVSSLIRDKLERLGARVFPGSPASPITTFVPNLSLELASKKLIEHGVSHASGRAGGIRLSPHGFTSEQDCERLFKALDECC